MSDTVRVTHDTKRRGAVSTAAFSRAPRLHQKAWIVCSLALMTSDCLAFFLAVAASGVAAWRGGAVNVLTVGASDEGASRAALLCALLLFVAVMLGFASCAHYARRIPFWSELRDVLVASTLALLCDGFVQYLLKQHESRIFIGMTWIAFPLAIMTGRRLTRHGLGAAGLWQLRAVLVGPPKLAEQAESALLSEPELGYQIVDVVSPDATALREPGGWKYVLQKDAADLLVIALDTNDPHSRELTESLVRDRLPFAAMPSLGGLPVLGFDQTCFFSHDTILFSYRNNLNKPVARITKLLFDLVVALCILVVFTPAFLVIAALIKLDGGSALFTHRRVGANGCEFQCYKFRTMVVDSDTVLQRVLRANPTAAAEWAETQKLRDDPRVTWIGKFLRTTSLDEMPQLFNVLRLEMSLVGPRPIVQAEVTRYAADIAYYYETRPGMTGLWQVSGRSETSYAHRVRLDTWYVKNWTIWHDLAILAKTFPAVLNRRGAV